MSAAFSRRALIVVIVAAASLLGIARPAAAAGEDAYFINAINAIRAGRGLAPLAVDAQLDAVALAWAQHMAAAGTLQHNPNVAGQVSGWRALGENVGTGPSVESIEAAFENSPHHFENMVDPQFTLIGVGVVRDAAGTYWVTENFKLPSSSARPAPAPAPRTPAPAAPKAASRAAAHPAPRPVAAPVPRPAAATAATPKPAPGPVATTQPPAPAPAPTVPLAVLGAATAQPHPVTPVVATLTSRDPFTPTNLTGLVAAIFLGAAMAMYARVRFRPSGAAIAG